MPWQYQDELDDSWKDMDKAISQALERAQSEGQDRTAYSLETPGGKFNYSVDFRTMTQRNVKSGTVRSIRDEGAAGGLSGTALSRSKSCSHPS